MEEFEEPCFSVNIFSLMLFHTCIITMLMLINYFSFLPKTQPSL